MREDTPRMINRAYNRGTVPENLRNIPRPPPYAPLIRATRVFRFICNTSVTGTSPVSVSIQDVLGYMQIANSATSSLVMFFAARVKRVQAWSTAPATAGSTVKVGIEWGSSGTTAGVGSPLVQIEDAATPFIPAHIDTRPPRWSSANLWADVTTVDPTMNAFSVTRATVGDIWDITVEYQMVGAPGSALSGDGSTGLTGGQVYYGYMDGRVSHKFTPEGDIQIIS